MHLPGLGLLEKVEEYISDVQAPIIILYYSQRYTSVGRTYIYGLHIAVGQTILDSHSVTFKMTVCQILVVLS
jgi:hypothetical protein